MKVVTECGTKHRLDDDQLEGEKGNKHAKTEGACISPSNESIVIKVEVDDGVMSNGVGNDNNRVSSISNDTSTVSNARDVTKDEVKLIAADIKNNATKGPEKPPAVLAVERFVTAIKSHVTKTFNLLVQSASRGESSVPDSEMDAVRLMTLEQMKLANTDMMSIGGIGCFSDDAMKSQMVCIVNKLRSNDIFIHADHFLTPTANSPCTHIP